MLHKQEANPQENNNAEARSQQSHFVTLLKSRPCTDSPPKICGTSPEHPPLEEHLWGTASACQKNFKRLKNYSKKVFWVTLWCLQNLYKTNAYLYGSWCFVIAFLIICQMKKTVIELLQYSFSKYVFKQNFSKNFLNFFKSFYIKE